MIKINIDVPLTIEDQDALQELYVHQGDGLTFGEFCKKILQQEIRWALDNSIKHGTT
mgnify:FL=1|tara:strand:- start:160 stop:330 length:171 start_codon:yes stop_codon:yes gene_type:complete